MTTSHPEINPKSQFYHSDGCGRDKYIWHNNGGLSASNLPKPELAVSSFRPKRLPSAPAPPAAVKTVRYASNGTGRDTYIIRGSGGFEAHMDMYSPKSTFYLSLRNDGKRPMRDTMSALWLPMASRLRLSEMARQQKRLTMRLTRTASNL